jgi:hypothetical protein
MMNFNHTLEGGGHKVQDGVQECVQHCPGDTVHAHL